MAKRRKAKSTESWLSELPAACSEYLDGRAVEEIEIIIPDLAGQSRGKSMLARKFQPGNTYLLPVSLFYQTISGEYVEMEIENQWVEKDVVLVPDLSTASAVPWADMPTLQIICDMQHRDGAPLAISPRNVLRRVIDCYDQYGLQPVVAPELEFYLAEQNDDPDHPIKPPVGRSGRKGFSRQVYSMSAVDEFGSVLDTIYDYADLQGLEIESVIQEGGAAQIEINLQHGDPMALADQVFYFKRTIREAALKNGVFATFMAKPLRDSPGSAMHVHQSVLDKQTGKNIFSNEDGTPSERFMHFIGGSQKYLMQTVPLMAPYVNSYRRITVDGQSAPANIEWAADNRTTGLRVPISSPENRRVENRVIGMDSNPYLAIAASLASGLLGIQNKCEPRDEAVNEVWEVDNALPSTLNAALAIFQDANDAWEMLSPEFCQLFLDIKRAENEEYQREISPWERRHLLLHV